MKKDPEVSEAFMCYEQNAKEHFKIWMEAVHKFSGLGKLDKKTGELAYIAVLAALRLESGLPFHVKQAKTLGASRDEVIGAILAGFPAAGNAVIQSMPAGVRAYDEDD